jgi:hypothetical protein
MAAQGGAHSFHFHLQGARRFRRCPPGYRPSAGLLEVPGDTHRGLRFEDADGSLQLVRVDSAQGVDCIVSLYACSMRHQGRTYATPDARISGANGGVRATSGAAPAKPHTPDVRPAKGRPTPKGSRSPSPDCTMDLIAEGAAAILKVMPLGNSIAKSRSKEPAAPRTARRRGKTPLQDMGTAPARSVTVRDLAWTRPADACSRLSPAARRSHMFASAACFLAQFAIQRMSERH